MLCGCNRQGQTSSVTAQPTTELVRVYIPKGHTELVTQMVKSFTDLHPKRRYAVILTEADDKEITAAALKQDEAADVLFFPSEKLSELAAAGVLQTAQSISQRCAKPALSAAKYEGRVYAYPCAAELCFLYYDKSKITDSEAASLNSILSKQIDGVRANFAADLTDSGFLSSFFLSAGCTFASPQSFCGEDGCNAAQLLVNLSQDDNFAYDYSEHAIKTAFAGGKIAAAVSYPDSAQAISSSLGKNLGAAKLPMITYPDGSTVQPVTTASFTLVGVNAHSCVSDTAHELAAWLTNYQNQLLRLEQSGCAPTDISIMQDKALCVKYPILTAVYRQLDYCVPVGSTARAAALSAAAEDLTEDITQGCDIYASLEQFARGVSYD